MVFLLFCLSLNIGFSQNFSPIFKNISDELPSSEVHDVFQDSIGYIWFATDRGIARYDGQNFLKLETEHLFLSSTFKFFKESSKKVWFSTGENHLYWFNPIQPTLPITPYSFNDTISSKINTLYKSNFIRMMYMDRNSCKVTFLKGTGYLEINEAGHGKIKNKRQRMYQSHKVSDLYINYSSNFCYSEFKANSTSPGRMFFVKNNSKDTLLITSRFSYNNFWMYGISDIQKYEESTYILLSKYLIRYENNKLTLCELPSEGLKIYKDIDRLLIGTFNGVFELDNNLNIKSSFLNSYSITAILKDDDNGFWFTTINSGVFHSKNIDLKLLNQTSTLNPKMLLLRNKQLYTIDKNKNLIIFDENGNISSKHKSVHYQNERFTGRETLTKHLGPYFLKDKSTNLCQFFPVLTSPPLYFAKGKAITKIENQHIIAIDTSEKSLYMNDCIALNDSTLIITTTTGVYTYNLTSKTKTLYQNSQKINFKQIEKVNNNLIITSNHGLYIYNKSGLTNLTTRNGLLSNSVNGIHISKDNAIWTYSNKGVNKIILTQNAKSSAYLTTQDGLPSNEVNAVASDSNYLWIGTKRGICKINIDYQIPSKQLIKRNFIIDSIVTNTNTQFNSDTIRVDHDAKINYYFKYITYQKNKAQLFEYQLDSSEWTKTSPNSLTIQNEAPGIHKLTIRPLNGSNEIIFHSTIIIYPHFSELTWFRLAVIALFSFFVFLLTKYFIKLKSKKKEEELVKLNLELKLLTSQMNPHFTFNSINSIQHYILKNKKKEAIKYLSDFALLIRQTLDFSFNSSISLETEINFLELYIELENKRFESNFTLELDLHLEANLQKVQIPSLLIQPLIENVILHAKYWDNQEKKITLHIYDFGTYLLIKVIDYGITGLKGTSLSKHKSYGLEIIRNRLKIYNGKNYDSSDLTFSATNKELQTGNTTTIKLYQHEDNYS